MCRSCTTRAGCSAIILIALAGSAILVFLLARGELAGADARAYWGAVRVWIDGGDPMTPPAPYMPYVYFPWTLPIFMPWAALPWEVAWFIWRGVNLVLLIWSVTWAYQRASAGHGTAVGVPRGAHRGHPGHGNITLFAALAVWAAQFVGPKVGGGLWALASVLKWFPAPLWLILPPRARLWGLIWASLAVILSLATWPQTLEQLQLAINYPRPFRGDYVLLLWAAVPWIWGHPRWFVISEWRLIVVEALARTRAPLDPLAGHAGAAPLPVDRDRAPRPRVPGPGAAHRAPRRCGGGGSCGGGGTRGGQGRRGAGSGDDADCGGATHHRCRRRPQGLSPGATRCAPRSGGQMRSPAVIGRPQPAQAAPPSPSSSVVPCSGSAWGWTPGS